MESGGESEQERRQRVLDAVASHFQVKHGQRPEYIPGDKIPYGGRVFDEREVIAAVEASLDFWLTTGPYTHNFEKELASFIGVRHSLFTNSGSSANLLAFSALTSPTLDARRVLPGDEVIAVAAAFPTTVAPVIQHGAVPVFVDITLPHYNIDCSMLEEALSERTRAVMIAHTLGNPFDVNAVRDFCRAHDLWLIEDNCDALGSMYRVDGAWRRTGSFGDLATSSFFPSHQITTGEGGAVCTDRPKLKRLIESFRDWGRDCWCEAGSDNTCGLRFAQQFSQLPFGYDHKYVYSHFGYNLKGTELQAAIGRVQLEKLPAFISARKANWARLREGLNDLEELFILPEPTPDSDPCWFGFALTVRPDAGFTRSAVTSFLEKRGIQTRALFAGNLLRHPCFDEMRAASRGFRVVGDLRVTDYVMDNTFWFGVYPGLTDTMLDCMLDAMHAFCADAPRKSAGAVG